LYHPFLLVRRGLHLLLLLSLQTFGLVLQAMLILYRNANRFQYIQSVLQLPWKEKGLGSHN